MNSDHFLKSAVVLKGEKNKKHVNKIPQENKIIIMAVDLVVKIPKRFNLPFMSSLHVSDERIACEI